MPDTPKSYEIIQQRHEYIISRILRGTVDEEIEGKIEYSEDGVFYKSKSDVFIKLLKKSNFILIMNNIYIYLIKKILFFK